MTVCSSNVIHVVLLYCSQRTGHFGQGAFVSALLPIFRSENKILKLTIIRTDSRHSKQVAAWIDNDGIEIIDIPPYPGVYGLTGENTLPQKYYANHIVGKIYPFLTNKQKLLLWVNSVDYLNIATGLKELFPLSKLLYVHHSFSWKYLINVEDTVFSTEWKKKNHSFHPLAFEMTSYQQKIAILSDATVAVTRHARLFLQNTMAVPAAKLHTIYNGVSFKNKAYDKATLRKKYGFSNTDKIILFSGRIVKDKGIKELLQAFKMLLPHAPEARLILIGTGEITEYLSGIAPYWNRVTLTGPLTPNQISEFYYMADVGILPSLHEQCSFSAIEMMIHKLPLIVAAVDGLDEIFEHQVDAIKISIDSSDSNPRQLEPALIAKNILLLLDDHQKKIALAKNALKKARCIFQLREMQKKYSDLILNIFE